MLSCMPDLGADTTPRLPLALSVAIVCKNNAGTIGRTLESVRGLASEIVAVDSGSTDGTIEILEQHGARVIRSEWLGHVKTKQKALEACTQQWTLCLDSDESVEPDLRGSIVSFVGSPPPGVAGARVRRVVWYRDHPLRNAWQPEWRLRLVARGQAAWSGLDPHDSLRMSSARRTIDLRGVLRHDSISTWSDFLAKQASHARTMALSLHAAGKKPSYFRLFGSPIGAVLKQLVLKSAWRDGWPGVLAAMSTGVGAAMKHMILFEIARASTASNGGSPITKLAAASSPDPKH